MRRLRISSIEITELTEEVLEVIKENKIIVDHLHIPLQAGSDEILNLMNRKYDLKYFYEKISSIKKIRPEISITTDVLVGFPGETKEMFERTIQTCQELELTKIHVFPYSDRTGTVASRMKNKVDGNIKKQRVHKLMELSNKLERQYFEENLNKEVEVLIEEEKEGNFYGFTSNYIPLKLQGNYNINEIYKINLKKEYINFDMNN